MREQSRCETGVAVAQAVTGSTAVFVLLNNMNEGLVAKASVGLARRAVPNAHSSFNYQNADLIPQ
jgi:hypothetical protein